MPAIQTVTVINKSGKIVSSGKHIASVFKEAKAAYQSRKAEIKATRASEAKAIRSHSDEDIRRRAESSRGAAHRTKSHRRRHSPDSSYKPKPLERGYTDSALADDVIYAHPASPPSFEAPDRELIRRNTTPGRPTSVHSYDSDLAYGEHHAPALPVRPSKDELELREKFFTIKNLLDEANCV